MTPDQFVIVTALTIGSIGAILLLYFIVLKRKGWLTEEKPSQTSYLCPNSECRKIFQQPITLMDLSTNPPRSYLACPNCGLDLATISFKHEKPESAHEIQPQRKVLSPDQDLAIGSKSPKPETPADAKIPESQEVSELTFRSKISKGLKRSASSQEPESLNQTSSRSTKKAKEKEEKKLPESPKACSHFFGYVKTLPKNTPIPDECMWCPLIVKCLTGAEEIEA